MRVVRVEVLLFNNSDDDKSCKALKVPLFFIWDTKYHRNRLICFLLKTPFKKYIKHASEYDRTTLYLAQFPVSLSFQFQK